MCESFDKKTILLSRYHIQRQLYSRSDGHIEEHHAQQLGAALLRHFAKIEQRTVAYGTSAPYAAGKEIDCKTIIVT